MSKYFVEGTIKIKIDVDIEATSLEEAEELALEKFNEENVLCNYAKVVDDHSDLWAGQYEGEEYND